VLVDTPIGYGTLSLSTELSQLANIEVPDNFPSLCNILHSSLTVKSTIRIKTKYVFYFQSIINFERILQIGTACAS